ITRHGQFVALYSSASNLCAYMPHGGFEAFLIDTKADTLEEVSLSNTGMQASDVSQPFAISDDGRLVLSSSLSDTLVSSDTNGHYDVFVRDRLLWTTDRISTDRLGLPTGGCFGQKRALAPRRTPRYLLFFCDNPDPRGPHYFTSFRYERQSQRAELLSVDD